MNKIRASLPWNSSNYVVLNAFHPLYLFLLNDSIQSSYDLLTFEPLAWRDIFHKNENAEVLWDHINSIAREISQNQEVEFKEFWSFFNLNEALCAEASNADLLITHTTMVASGLKPFIFHLEGFETLFYPWHIQDNFLKKTTSQKKHAIKNFIQKRMENPNCIAIVSHVKKTVENIRDCFNSDIINKKLFFSPLGIPAPYSERLLKNAGEPRRFLFTPSLHGNCNNSLARGFLTCLFFAEAWLKKYPQDEFVFLSSKPKYDSQWKWITRKQWDRITCHSNMVFLGGNYISDERLSSLLKNIDYVFLLSYQLHSVSLLRSMVYGVIPIVFDLPEHMDYGINDHNSIFVKIYNQLDLEKQDFFGERPLLDFFVKKTIGAVPEILAKVAQIRNDPEAEWQYRKNGQKLVRDNFNDKIAAECFRDILNKQYKDEITPLKEPNKHDAKLEEYFGGKRYFFPNLRPVKYSDFDKRPIHYVMLNLGTAQIYSNGEEHIAVTTASHLNPPFVTCFNINNYSPSVGLSYTFQEAFFNALNYSYKMPTEDLNTPQKYNVSILSVIGSFVVKRPMLKRIILPLFRIYKKLAPGYAASLKNVDMRMPTGTVLSAFVKQRPKLKGMIYLVKKYLQSFGSILSR